MSVVKTYSGAPYAAITHSALQRRLLRNASFPPRASKQDALQLVPSPLVPEIHLFLAEDPVLLWARLEADARASLTAPFWATAWSGGQALARYVLDNPELVAGKRVLDLASGSGLVAIAAAMAGAESVLANDIDGYAIAAIQANANANGVTIDCDPTDLTGGDCTEIDVILAGDALYNPDVAAVILPFAERAAARGVTVLFGDPGRGYAPEQVLRPLATYRLQTMGSAEDAQNEQASVFALAGAPVAS